MIADEAVTAFSALPADRRIAVLARYAFEMTIVARGTYVPGTEGIADPQRLRFHSFEERLNRLHRRTPAEGVRIWEEHVVGGRPVPELLYHTQAAGTNVLGKQPDGSFVPVGGPHSSRCSRCPA